MELNNVDIPYGVLHDQRLISVREERNQLIFSFDIKIYPQDYNGDFYKNYQLYNRCDMIVEMVDKPFNYFNLTTTPNNRGKYKGLSLSRQDFIDYINDSESVFIGCSTNEFEFCIELCVNFFNSKKYKKLKKYDICNIEIDCNKSVFWKWYNE